MIYPDGFGLGFYDAYPDPDPCPASNVAPKDALGKRNPNTPCIFTAITPAWSNRNLHRLAEKLKSRLVFAHVRASTMGVVSEPNCHPWSLGSLMFMHNGEVANFNAIKRKLQAALDDRFFNLPGGGTDSEWCFSLFLQKLSKLADVDAPCFPFRILQQAVLETISTLNAWAAEAGTTEPSLLNFCVTDGHTIIATRYISSRTDEAASLWFSTGSSFEQYKSGGYYRMRKNDKRENIVLIASEPLTFEKADWLEIPCQTCVVVTNRMNVLQIPIVDEFSQTTPSPRNQFFATAKGYEFSKPIVKPVPQAVVIPVSPTATVVVQTSANPTTKPADIAAAATAS